MSWVFPIILLVITCALIVAVIWDEIQRRRERQRGREMMAEFRRRLAAGESWDEIVAALRSRL